MERLERFIEMKIKKFTLLEISELGQLWPPKKLNEWWIILKLDRKIKFELNEDVKNNLFLELGENYLNEIIMNKKNDSCI